MRYRRCRVGSRLRSPRCPILFSCVVLDGTLRPEKPHAIYARRGISARMESSLNALGLAINNSHTLVKLVAKLAQQDMNVQANFYPQFFVRRVTILF
jgi:hypothetical protein